MVQKLPRRGQEKSVVRRWEVKLLKKIAYQALAVPLGIVVLLDIAVEETSEVFYTGLNWVGNKICDTMDKLEDDNS